VIAAFRHFIKRMVSGWGNGYMFNARTRTYLSNVDAVSMNSDLFGTRLKAIGRKDSVTSSVTRSVKEIAAYRRFIEKMDLGLVNG
jgi:hypothetical protein